MNKLNYIKWLLIGLGWALFFIGCADDSIDVEEEPSIEYSFFVAGHAYGKPGVDNVGVHPPLADIYPYLNELEDLELGVFTGDVVLKSTEENWTELEEQLALLDAETYIAPGNHDLGDINLYKNYNGATNFNFNRNGDLFVILETTTTNWKVTPEKISEIKATIDSTLTSMDKVFIFCHQLLWYEPNTKYDGCPPNSLEGKVGESDFFKAFVPMLSQFDQQVFIYAGDLGAFENGCALMYEELDNVTLIASGMGGGLNDNIVLTHIYDTGDIRFEVIALNGEDKTKLGLLEDYRI